VVENRATKEEANGHRLIAVNQGEKYKPKNFAKCPKMGYQKEIGRLDPGTPKGKEACGQTNWVNQRRLRSKPPVQTGKSQTPGRKVTN